MNSRDDLIAAVASAAHEDWRTQYKATNGDTPRVKKTKDTAFNERGITEVDIAALSYSELPSDWQAENKAGATCAVDCVLAALEAGRELDDSFIEEASATQHDDWLTRNGEWAPDEQKRPYSELSEDDKEKDRFFVKQAIAATAS
jgi:hypothetical protein